jgi:CDP-diacylglycerol--serine O-phosphatidyltransferase
MLRDFHAADFVTLLNGVAGMSASLAFVRYVAGEGDGSFWLGAALLPVALLMDILDGRVARFRGESSEIGRELDSLADIVSFGVAPAIMGFAVGLRGALDLVCLTIFVACGISRLARYNVTATTLSDESGKVSYFEGMPIPSSLLLASLFAVLFGVGRAHDALPLGSVQVGPAMLHPVALVYLLHGAAMVSKTLRVPKP